MNWEDLAEPLGAVAPTLGRLLGGALPIPFGATIGGAIGTVIAGAMGVQATPDVVHDALKNTPADVLRAQLQTAESEAAAKYRAFAEIAKADSSVGVAQVQATAATTQAELVNGAWYQRWWRPLGMFVWISTWPIQLGTILWHISSRDPTAIANLASVVNALALWNAGPAAFAGVYSWNRTQEKIAAQ